MTVAIETTVKEHPILFSGPMIRAILENRKTQTRRVVKPQPEAAWMDWVINTNLGGDNRYWVDGEPTMHLNMEKDFSSKGECPYGKPGDRLWVREAWAIADIYDKDSGNQGQMPFELGGTTQGISIWYKAGGGKHFKASNPGRWRSPLFMPRAASRITLEITDVRVERLQAITEADAIAEGMYSNTMALAALGLPPETPFISPYHVDKYRIVWESINGKKYPWASNPWVWCVEFKRVEVSK
jgi:hypothetical protein